MKRVLLTGASGFIGSRAIEPLLETGFEVYAVTSRETARPTAENLTWHRADLLDSARVRGLLAAVRPTHLLHFAWYMEHGKVWHTPENLAWLAASLDLVKNFRESGGRRAVLCGTLSEYACAESEPLLEYEAELKPDSLYGAAKKALFEVAAKYAERESLSFAWGRVFFQFGRNEAPNRLVASIARSLLAGERAKASHGNQIRDYLSADETASAFVALLDSDVEGAVNIGSGEKRTIKEIATEVASLLGKSAADIDFGAVPSPPGEPPFIVADVSRLRNEVGWQPAKSFSERLAETVEWWKENYR